MGAPENIEISRPRSTSHPGKASPNLSGSALRIATLFSAFENKLFEHRAMDTNYEEVRPKAEFHFFKASLARVEFAR
jgi:hypothetical protein